MKSNRGFFWLCAGVIATGGLVLVAISQGWFASGDSGPELAQQREQEQIVPEEKRLASIPNNREALAKALGIKEDELELRGGVLRPKRDLAFTSKENQSKDPKDAPSVEDFMQPTSNVGVAPRLKGNENPQVAGLMAELTGEAPVKEAMSSYFREEEKFDREAYTANPTSYLNKIRPARAYSPANPDGEDVTPLESQTPGFHNVLQGEQVVLRVKGTAGQPVTFYSPATGHFLANQLTTLTVEADKDGIATATYKTGPGSLGLTDVVVASPVNSGQLQYRINVEVPEQPLGQN